ncbi:hypothetical protein [Butyricicoccus sp.]|uniref:hypothetical protein n=1 Tax=Butyricicoccus sp. TaxID=2049021 RepID=UPI003F17658C
MKYQYWDYIDSLVPPEEMKQKILVCGRKKLCRKKIRRCAVSVACLLLIIGMGGLWMSEKNSAITQTDQYQIILATPEQEKTNVYLVYEDRVYAMCDDTIKGSQIVGITGSEGKLYTSSNTLGKHLFTISEENLLQSTSDEMSEEEKSEWIGLNVYVYAPVESNAMLAIKGTEKTIMLFRFVCFRGKFTMGDVYGVYSVSDGKNIKEITVSLIQTVYRQEKQTGQIEVSADMTAVHRITKKEDIEFLLNLIKNARSPQQHSEDFYISGQDEDYYDVEIQLENGLCIYFGANLESYCLNMWDTQLIFDSAQGQAWEDYLRTLF